MDAVLIGDNGLKLLLSIDSYQQTEYTDIHDGNWLVMRLTIETPVTKHEFLDPCLLTWEYLNIARWLKTIESDDAEPAIGSMDNLLEFYLHTVNDEPVLLIYADTSRMRMPHESDQTGQPQTQLDESRMVSIPTVFPFRLNDFKQIAAIIESQLQNFPIREPQACEYYLNNPFYLERYMSNPWILLVFDQEDTLKFATYETEALDRYFSDVLGLETYTRLDYEEMYLNELRKTEMLTDDEIEILLREGKIEL